MAGFFRWPRSSTPSLCFAHTGMCSRPLFFLRAGEQAPLSPWCYLAGAWPSLRSHIKRDLFSFTALISQALFFVALTTNCSCYLCCSFLDSTYYELQLLFRLLFVSFLLSGLLAPERKGWVCFVQHPVPSTQNSVYTLYKHLLHD